MNFRQIIKAQRLANRVIFLDDGTRVIVRFNFIDRLEHLLLIISFTTLAITGMVQRYSDLTFAARIINQVFGGIDTVRVIHHVAALVMAVETIFHFWRILMVIFVNREIGNMLPTINDLKDTLHVIRFNLGLANERPKFDRFSVEEKVEYWALIWGTVVMGITGIIQWFPIELTKILPGWIIPVSRAVHSWEAVLAVLAILLWHTYHTVIKEQNLSIFKGYMSEEEMEHNHPLEYERIIEAYEWMRDLQN